MKIDWAKMDGLVPAVVQDVDTRQVLMVGYMNEQAVAKTSATKKVTFFSRSKGRLWTKGETSDHFLELVSMQADCDEDAILVLARPQGPTCHRDTTSCFGDEKAPGVGFLGYLNGVVERRFRDMPEGSYTTKLIREGIDRMAQKVGEEGVEVVIAAKNPDVTAFRGEAADLLFHLMVLLRARDLTLFDVIEHLRSRHK